MIPTPRFQAQGVGAVTATDLNSVVQACSSLMQMRNTVGIEQVVLYLEGFAYPGDGGQGHFVWNAFAPGPDDGVSVIVPLSASVGAWIRQTGLVTRSLLLSGVYINSNTGGTPGSNQILDMWVLPQVTMFPAGLLGSVYHNETSGLPATTRNCLINLNDSHVGALTANVDGTYAYSTVSPTGFTAAAGQWITLVAPVSADTTWNLFGFTLVGATIS